MPYARRDDLSLYYEQAGSGEPRFLFVHGWCCDHNFFAPQYEHFGASHSVTAPDLRGCGQSDRPADGYEVRTFADDLAWLCAEIGVSRPIVVGHSLGGMIAIELTARYPSLALAVVALDPGPINPTPETRQIFEGFADQLEGPEGEAVRRAWIEPDLSPAAAPDLKRRVLDTMCAVPLANAAAVIRGAIAWNGVAALAMCEVPLLVLRSGPGGSNTAERLLPLKPDLRYGVTIGAGHFFQLEVPEQVTPMIERFLEVAVPASTG